MSRKTPQQTNVLIHLAAWTLGTPLLFVAMGGGLFAALGAPSHETLIVSVLATIIGLPLGFFLGIASFFVVRGLRGWSGHFAGRRAEQAAVSEAAHADHIAQNIADHLSETNALDHAPENSDPWNGTNPYGCCQDNYDENGDLTHGSPDCLHPLILEQRQA